MFGAFGDAPSEPRIEDQVDDLLAHAKPNYAGCELVLLDLPGNDEKGVR